MAKTLSLQKSFSGLMTLIFTFVVTAPGVWLTDAPRASAASFNVINNNDSGAGSMRQAIIDANANVGEDVITIDVSLSTQTVVLLTDLPEITEGVTIDGTLNVAPLTLAVPAGGSTAGLIINNAGVTTIKGLKLSGNTTQGLIRLNSGTLNVGADVANGGVILTGSTNGGSAGLYQNGGVLAVHRSQFFSNNVGIRILGGTSAAIGGDVAAFNLFYSNTNDGISVENPANMTLNITFNRIGTNGAGTVDQGNGGNGIYLGAAISGATVENNLISGNGGYGIVMDCDNSTVRSNNIGVDITGDAAIPNDNYGLLVRGSGNTIGGSAGGQRNYISGNTVGGVHIDGSSGGGSNTIIRNTIGLNDTASAVIANGLGIKVSANSADNLIGTAGNGNEISGNTGDGILITGAGSINNSIQGNSIGITFPNGGNGITLQSDQTVIGTADLSSARNIIGGNTGYGIYLNGADQTTIVNNNIGIAADDTTLFANGNNAIEIDSTAAQNTIGALSGSRNRIGASLGLINVHIANDAGDFNAVHVDTFQSPIVANTAYVTRDGASNESIAAPTFTSTVQSTPTLVTVTGTAPANSTVDFYVDGAYNSSAVATAGGTFSASLTSTGGTYVTAIATNGTNSSSSSTSNTLITADVTAPSAPVLSYSSTGTPGTTATISGSSGEVGATVYVNGVSTGTTVAGDGTYSYIASLLEGTNTFSFTLVDPMSNTSSATVATISAVTASGGAGTSVSAGAAGHGIQSTVDEDPIDAGTTDTTPESMAGDTEVVTEPNTPVETPVNTPVVTPVQTTPGTINTPVTQPSTNTTGGTKNVSGKTFYSGIYQYVEPIKEVSIRDTMPANPARGKVFDPKFLGSKIFTGKTINGIPGKLLEIKLGDSAQNPNGDDDNDGLLNIEEVEFGTNPFVKDSDADGKTDFQETQFDGTDPASWDSDKDWIADNIDENPVESDNILENSNAQELNTYIAENVITEPLGTVDSDNDGLCDELELLIGSNPQEKDSDNDGISDGDEGTQYGSDPTNPNDPVVAQNSSASGSSGLPFRVSNAEQEDTVAAGEQFFMGSADPDSTVGIYSVGNDGSMTLLGDTQADENGRYTIYTTEPLKAGTYTLVAIQGTLEKIEDISPTFTMNVIDWVKRPEYVSLALKNNASITDRQPIIDLLVPERYLVVISWRSTVYSQVLIADSANQVIYAEPNKELELGSHTVTWYAQDPATGNKSNPTRVAFNVTNEAFVSGQSGENSPWTLILGSIAVLSSLAALGLYFRKKN